MVWLYPHDAHAVQVWWELWRSQLCQPDGRQSRAQQLVLVNVDDLSHRVQHVLCL